MKNTSLSPLDYNIFLAPNSGNTETRPRQPHSAFPLPDLKISSRIEEKSLIIDVEDPTVRPTWPKKTAVALSIEFLASVENPNELVEKWVHIPTKTEAKITFTKADSLPNGYTWCKE